MKEQTKINNLNLTHEELEILSNLLHSILLNDIIPDEIGVSTVQDLHTKLLNAQKHESPVYWMNVYLRHRTLDGYECIMSTPYSNAEHAADEYVYYLDNFQDPSLYQSESHFHIVDFNGSALEPIDRHLCLTEDETSIWGFYSTICLEMHPGRSTRTSWDDVERDVYEY